MKTKPDTIVGVNGNGNGAGPGVHGKLQRLYTFHASRAEAIRLVLAMLDDTAAERRALRSHNVMVEAVRLDAERRKALPPAKRKSQPGDWTTGAIKKRRTKTLKTLARFSKDASKPTTHLGKGMQPLLRHGYLKSVSGGWIRTEKEFVP